MSERSWTAEDYERDREAARADPVRVARYLGWWARRPSRWLRNLAAEDSEDSEENIPDLPGAELFSAGAELFYADGGAHHIAVELGLLVADPRPRVTAWQLSDAGLAFFEQHYRAPPQQLGLFG